MRAPFGLALRKRVVFGIVGVDDVIDAAGSGPLLMVGFNRRFDPNFAAVKAALDAGEVGKGEMLAVTSYDPAPPPVSLRTSSTASVRAALTPMVAPKR